MIMNDIGASNDRLPSLACPRALTSEMKWDQAGRAGCIYCNARAFEIEDI